MGKGSREKRRRREARKPSPSTTLADSSEVTYAEEEGAAVLARGRRTDMRRVRVWRGPYLHGLAGLLLALWGLVAATTPAAGLGGALGVAVLMTLFAAPFYSLLYLWLAPRMSMRRIEVREGGLRVHDVPFPLDPGFEVPLAELARVHVRKLVHALPLRAREAGAEASVTYDVVAVTHRDRVLPVFPGILDADTAEALADLVRAELAPRLEAGSRPLPPALEAPESFHLTPGQGSCPICGDPLGEDPGACPACGTGHHEECWEYNSGCATYGCGG